MHLLPVYGRSSFPKGIRRQEIFSENRFGTNKKKLSSDVLGEFVLLL